MPISNTPSYPKILAIQTGRRVPQASGKTLFVVTEDEEGDCLSVQETTPAGHIIACIKYAAADPELSVTRAIQDFRLRVNHWGQRR